MHYLVTQQAILKMVRYFHRDHKRINHAFKVLGYAKTIAEGEGLKADTLQVIELAAIIHDIGIPESERKYQSSAPRYQEAEGPAIARKILDECGADEALTERVCFLVGHHHRYNKIDGIDFQILVESDFLVNIQEGFIKPGAAPAVVRNYFRTTTGKELAASLYGF